MEQLTLPLKSVKQNFKLPKSIDDLKSLLLTTTGFEFWRKQNKYIAEHNKNNDGYISDINSNKLPDNFKITLFTPIQNKTLFSSRNHLNLTFALPFKYFENDPFYLRIPEDSFLKPPKEIDASSTIPLMSKEHLEKINFRSPFKISVKKCYDLEDQQHFTFGSTFFFTKNYLDTDFFGFPSSSSFTLDGIEVSRSDNKLSINLLSTFYKKRSEDSSISFKLSNKNNFRTIIHTSYVFYLSNNVLRLDTDESFFKIYNPLTLEESIYKFDSFKLFRLTSIYSFFDSLYLFKQNDVDSILFARKTLSLIENSIRLFFFNDEKTSQTFLNSFSTKPTGVDIDKFKIELKNQTLSNFASFPNTYDYYINSVLPFVYKIEDIPNLVKDLKLFNVTVEHLPQNSLTKKICSSLQEWILDLAKQPITFNSTRNYQLTVSKIPVSSYAIKKTIQSITSSVFTDWISHTCQSKFLDDYDGNRFYVVNSAQLTNLGHVKKAISELLSFFSLISLYYSHDLPYLEKYLTPYYLRSLLMSPHGFPVETNSEPIGAWIAFSQSNHLFSHAKMTRYFLEFFCLGEQFEIDSPYLYQTIHDQKNCNYLRDLSNIIDKVHKRCKDLSSPEYDYARIVDWRSFKDIYSAHDALAKAQNRLQYPNIKCNNPYYVFEPDTDFNVPETSYTIIFAPDTDTVRDWGQTQAHCIANYAEHINSSKYLVFGVWDNETNKWFGHAIYDVQDSSSNTERQRAVVRESYAKTSLKNVTEWQFYGYRNRPLNNEEKKKIINFVYDLIFSEKTKQDREENLLIAT